MIGPLKKKLIEAQTNFELLSKKIEQLSETRLHIIGQIALLKDLIKEDQESVKPVEVKKEKEVKKAK